MESRHSSTFNTSQLIPSCVYALLPYVLAACRDTPLIDSLQEPWIQAGVPPPGAFTCLHSDKARVTKDMHKIGH